MNQERGLSTTRFWSIDGLVSYSDARNFQLELVDKRARDEIPDTILFLEHKPVITQGRGLQFTGKPRERHLPVPVHLPPGMSFAESERGGDLTYHGPGQLVVYPIVKLDGSSPLAPHHDIGGFLRAMERWFLAALSGMGLSSEARESATGVWVGERKVASIGVAVRKWVTYHGIAINAVNDLKPFHLISPCGFAPEVMTSLRELLPERVELGAGEGSEADFPGWRPWLESRLIAAFPGHNPVAPTIAERRRDLNL